MLWDGIRTSHKNIFRVPHGSRPHGHDRHKIYSGSPMGHVPMDTTDASTGLTISLKPVWLSRSMILLLGTFPWSSPSVIHATTSHYQPMKLDSDPARNLGNRKLCIISYFSVWGRKRRKKTKNHTSTPQNQKNQPEIKINIKKIKKNQMTSRPLTSSLSLGVPVPRPTQCIRGA